MQAQIETGMKVYLDIELKDNINGTRNILTLTSVVEELLDGGGILIHMPIHRGYHYPLPREEAFLMKFSVGSDMYALRVQFEDRIEKDGFIFAKMQRLSKIESHQQRDCYRYPCSFPVTLKRASPDETSERPESELREARTIDFSDGGMLLATDESIEKGDQITLTFDIGEVETIDCMALRVEKIEEGNHKFKLAVQFKNANKIQKRRFYKYIVDKQMEERRRWTSGNKPLY